MHRCGARGRGTAVVVVVVVVLAVSAGSAGAPDCGWGTNLSSMSRGKGPSAKRKVTRWTTPVPLAMARSTLVRKSFAFCGVVT
eukprot:12921600-Prorocentrum_lima.AAC.1